jgi:hypothetical protein
MAIKRFRRPAAAAAVRRPSAKQVLKKPSAGPLKKPSADVPEVAVTVPAVQGTYVKGYIVQEDGLSFAFVNGRKFQIPPWMNSKDALRNLHLEVDCVAHKSFFVPCSSIEFIYGVTPTVMSAVSGIRVITGFKDAAYNFGFVHNDGNLPDYQDKYLYNAADFGFEEEGVSSAPAALANLTKELTDADFGSMVAEVQVLSPSDRMKRLVEILSSRLVES